jgi:hypothetical protein
MHVSTQPFGPPGQQKVELWVHDVDEDSPSRRCIIYDGPFNNAAWAEGQRLELWIIATLRNVLSIAEAELFSRLTEGQEKLTLIEIKRH